MKAYLLVCIALVLGVVLIEQAAAKKRTDCKYPNSRSLPLEYWFPVVNANTLFGLTLNGSEQIKAHFDFAVL